MFRSHTRSKGSVLTALVCALLAVAPGVGLEVLGHTGPNVCDVARSSELTAGPEAVEGSEVACNLLAGARFALAENPHACGCLLCTGRSSESRALAGEDAASVDRSDGTSSDLIGTRPKPVAERFSPRSLRGPPIS